MYDNYNYPMGADTPSAPWNQVEVEPKEIEVTVSITLSKTVKIEVNDYATDIDEGSGSKYCDFSECDLERAVKEQVTLPDQAYDKLHWAVYSCSDSNAQNDLEDLKDWEVDDFAVVLD